MADEPDMKKLLKQAMLEQKEAFRKKFGRDPQPGDPVFFDPSNDHPEPVGLNEGKVVKETLEAMEAASSTASDYLCLQAHRFVAE